MSASTNYNRKGDEAERLGIGTRTLERWVASRIVPCRRIGKVLLFSPAEVDQALTRFAVQAIGSRAPRKRPMQRAPLPTVTAAT
jgi:excisionase family DNA binding protein